MRALLVCWIASFGVGNAFGWGCDGHQIVALMARAQLKPAVSAMVDQILSAGPISPSLSRFCKDRSADIMADAATWADDVRNQEENGAWHFVNIPMTFTKIPRGHSVTQWCGDLSQPKAVCITAALEAQLAILKNPLADSASRGDALRYVIHLVGDLHQPLHDSNNNDQGGNCTVMTFLGQERTTNLHSIWDTRLLTYDMEHKQLDRAGYATAIAAEFAKKRKGWAKQKFDPTLWAWQGSQLAGKLAYGSLSPRIPLETPGVTNCDAERDKIAALKINVDENYAGRTTPEIREQMAKSATRLASLLNRTL